MEELLKKYADVAVRIGVNVQKGQTLVINSPVECADFARALTKAGYEAGAKEVYVEWNDDTCTRLKYLHASEEVFEDIPQWRVDRELSFARGGAAFLDIYAEDPELFKGVDPKRIAKYSKIASTKLKEVHERTLTNKNAWSIVSIPTKSWAEKVFSEKSSEEAVKDLWYAIFKVARMDKNDPVQEWTDHLNNLNNKSVALNKIQLKKLHYTNSLGTDLWIELPKGHLWMSGSGKVQETGVSFIPNMPTEEVFTVPDKNHVNGVVYSALPLSHNGNLVKNFKITFKDGKVVDYDAECGKETLKTIIETDEGATRLGEVALVPYDSPISQSGILFYNTLFDENASCHLALGAAYLPSFKNYENMSKEELDKCGINDSLTHVDFMVGTKDLNITGYTESGEEVQIFNEGNWAI